MYWTKNTQKRETCDGKFGVLALNDNIVNVFLITQQALKYKVNRDARKKYYFKEKITEIF